MTLMDFIAVVAIYVEIAVLAIIDMKLWRTIYTPLNLLMLPYALMLTVALIACGNWDIVEFYYPSLQVWMIGLPIFAIPSYIFGLYMHNKIDVCVNDNYIDDNINMRVLNIVSTILVVMYILRFILMLRTSPYLPGSEDFGEVYAGRGLWGHLNRILHVLSIIYIYKYDKKHWYYLLLVAGMFFVTLMYGVKSWVLIPAIAGICMRLYTGKTKLKFGLVVRVILLAFIVFIITYTFSLFLGVEENDSYDMIFMFICRAFVHYIISGIVGLSMDMQLGVLETPNFDVLLANILNLYNVIMGNEYVYAINPFFLHNGINGSNVRTFFGTIYVNSNIIQFILLVLFNSALVYILKVLTLISKNIYLNVIYYFIGGMLIMGWFDYFLYTLPAIEVPGMALFVCMMMKIGFKKNNSETLSAENCEQDGSGNTQP